MVKAVVGANWGDEGKGKITDMLAKEADIIIRFQGGANAGHTIVNDYGKFALHTLPSGVFYGHTTSIIGNGVALNIPVLIKEISSITEKNVPMPKILVSDRAQVVMPYHILFDQYEEERLGGKSFGSTKSGIAPFYSDKYAKIGFQVCELFDEEGLKTKLASVCETKNVLLEHLYHKPKLDVEELVREKNGGKPVKVVANLPYYITTPIIMQLFESHVPLESITIMVQTEVAERMQVGPGTKDYGALSLAVQYYSRPEIVTHVPPSCFMPRPNVGSTVIRLNRYEKPPVETADEEFMFRLIRASFNQRRKTLVNGLSNASGLNLTKEEVTDALEKMGLPATVRGETFTLEQFARLGSLLYKGGPA